MAAQEPLDLLVLVRFQTGELYNNYRRQTMGYYSTFEVIDTDIQDIVDVLNDVLEDTAHPGWVTRSDESIHGYDGTKWCYWIDDLQLIAKKYPDKFLVIERCGEDSPDISRAIVRNGTVREVEPEIVWPEY
jgi:hypothetical protein